MNTKPDRFVPPKEMRRMTGLASSTAYELMKRGQFPRNRKITPKKVAWLESELVAWMNSRPAFGAKAA